jgi:hypothetical protein
MFVEELDWKEDPKPQKLSHIIPLKINVSFLFFTSH